MLTLLSLNGQGELLATSLDKKRLVEEEMFELPADWGLQQLSPNRSMNIVKPDVPLLLVTSRYRFLPTTASHLSDLNELGLDVADFFPA